MESRIAIIGGEFDLNSEAGMALELKSASPGKVRAGVQRELEVLTHLAKGSRYKEIADELSISVLTARSHLQRIYEKLHVRSRTTGGGQVAKRHTLDLTLSA